MEVQILATPEAYDLLKSPDTDKKDIQAVIRVTIRFAAAPRTTSCFVENCVFSFTIRVVEYPSEIAFILIHKSKGFPTFFARSAKTFFGLVETAIPVSFDNPLIAHGAAGHRVLV